MSAELHLPDLPEVSLSLGADGALPAVPREAPPGWGQRLRGWASTFLPLILMAALAGYVVYLTRLTPAVPVGIEAAVVRHQPDYSLRRFHSERFDADGRLSVALEGEQLHHFPDTDEIEIERVHVRATDTEGRALEATALQALVSADGNRIELRGGAHVHSEAPGVAATDFDGEHLQLWVREQRVSASKPVTVRQGASEFRAQALQFEGRSRQLTLHGPARVQFNPMALKR